MDCRHLIASAAVALLLAGAAPARPAADTTGQKIWTKDAPDFSVTRYSDGGQISLSDVKGKVALLYFFFPT